MFFEKNSARLITICACTFALLGATSQANSEEAIEEVKDEEQVEEALNTKVVKDDNKDGTDDAGKKSPMSNSAPKVKTGASGKNIAQASEEKQPATPKYSDAGMGSEPDPKNPLGL